MANVYKSRKGIMPLGLLAIAVAVGIAGCLLSFVYLKINEVCPSVYLCILIAFGFGAAMGGIAYFLIKVMKIRSKTTALLGVLIGCLVFTVFKWALYVQWDNEKIFKKIPSAWEYCEFYCDFTYDGNVTSEPVEEEVVEYVISAMKEMTATEYLEEYYVGGTSAYIKDIKEYNGTTVTEKELEKVDSFTWFYGDFVKKGKEAESILNSYEMDTDEYFEYIGKYPDVLYLITHPAEFFDNIKFINGYGRWTVGSSSSSITNANSGKNNNVKGIMLWIVWIGEIFVICIPAIVIACKRAEKPFIEFENEWATLNESDGFMLKAPTVPAAAATAFKGNPECIFTYEHLLARPGNAPYVKLKLYHSKQYDENYASLCLYTFVPKNKKHAEKDLVKYVTVSKDFVYRFFQHCGQHIPFTYTPSYTAPATAQAVNNPMDIFNADISDVKKMEAPTSSMMDAVSPSLADEKSQDDVLKELNS